MRIRCGYEITYECPRPTPMLALLNVHSSRYQNLETPDLIRTDPQLAVTQYHDGFANLCSRFVLPAGRTVISSDFVVRDSGEPDPICEDAIQHPVEHLPNEVIVFLLASRYCETEHLSNLAWSLFGDIPPGWGRAQAIVKYAHERIKFGYEHARPTKTAFEAHEERLGVCRDYAHLAITLLRAAEFPARAVSAYAWRLKPPDLHAVVEVYVGGRWRLVDPTGLAPVEGLVRVAAGLDAADIAFMTIFGRADLISQSFSISRKTAAAGAR